MGQPIGDSGFFSFPTPEALAAATAEQLAPLRCGFRARYLIDAAQKVCSGQVRLDAIPSMPLEEARQELMQICGIGPKVADCVLLFGFHRLECCPMDVWMKRVFAVLYPNGLPDCARDFVGIAQQYLFHYARTCPRHLTPRRCPHEAAPPHRPAAEPCTAFLHRLQPKRRAPFRPFPNRGGASPLQPLGDSR